MAAPGKRFLAAAIDTDLVVRLDKVAAARGVSRSKYVEEIVRDALDEDEQVVRALNDPVLMPAMMGAFAKPEVLRAMAGVMRAEMSDQQLALFQQSMQAVSE